MSAAARFAMFMVIKPEIPLSTVRVMGREGRSIGWGDSNYEDNKEGSS
jgi:hypothetical protein